MEGRLNPALVALVLLTAAGCGTAKPAADIAPEWRPLPTAGLAGRKVTVYPLTMIAADRALGWDEALEDRRAALDRADSAILATLESRAAEVLWVTPEQLRRASRRAPGLLADPDRLALTVLAGGSVFVVPDPLRSQMRGLTGVAGDRYALVPAGLIYRRGAPDAGGEAELRLVMTDVRTGTVGWRSTLRGTGSDPWSALRAALDSLFPGLP
ncbi:MAG: hypothetical protein ACE5PT_07775 [Gemmatimonadales bacterium]